MLIENQGVAAPQSISVTALLAQWSPFGIWYQKRRVICPALWFFGECFYENWGKYVKMCISRQLEGEKERLKSMLCVNMYGGDRRADGNGRTRADYKSRAR